MAIYRYKLGNIDRIQRDHTIFSQCNIANIKGSLYLDVELDSSIKDKIDGIMGNHGYYYYADITSASGNMANSSVMLGNKMNYPLSAVHDAGKIQFTQVWIDGGHEVVSFDTFLDKSKSGATIWMALYSQDNKLDEGDEPSNLVCSASKILNGSELELLSVHISPHLISENGYYWLAILSDSRDLKWTSSMPVRKGLLPVIYQDSSTLPAQTSNLYKENGRGIIYVSAKLRG